VSHVEERREAEWDFDLIGKLSEPPIVGIIIGTSTAANSTSPAVTVTAGTEPELAPLA
jgi:hypothetical protein